MSADDLIRRGDAVEACRYDDAHDCRDAIAALPAVAAPGVPADGRPCATDLFLVAAMEQLDDKWDFFEAVKDWCEGDWKGALTGIELPAALDTPAPALMAELVEALRLADAALSGANMDMRAVEKKVRAVLARIGGA